MMTMSKQHYKVIARAIASAHESLDDICVEGTTDRERSCMKQGIYWATIKLMDELELDNSQFNAKQFAEACAGVDK